MDRESFVAGDIAFPNIICPGALVDRATVFSDDDDSDEAALRKILPGKDDRFSVWRFDGLDFQGRGAVQRGYFFALLRRSAKAALFSPAPGVEAGALPQVLAGVPEVVAGIGVEHPGELPGQTRRGGLLAGVRRPLPVRGTEIEKLQAGPISLFIGITASADHDGGE